MSELPSGWAETKFSEILGHHSGNSKLIKGKLHSSPSEGRYQGFSASGADVWLDHYEQEGTAIIISAVGARCGKCFLAKGKWTAIANTHVVKPASGELNAKFFWYLLNNEEFWVKGGSGQPFVKTKASFDRPFLLPPSFEQRRIVEKIEQLFDLLDKGEESLRAARDKAGLYRQSLLKHAFEGHLTADWRAANPDKLEAPETLLTRIQEERDARYKQAHDDWQDALAKWRADGEKGKKPAKPKRAKEVKVASAKELMKQPTLPANWVYAKVAQLAKVGTGVTPLKSNSAFYEPKEVPWVTSAVVNSDFVREPDNFVSKQAFEETNLTLFPAKTLLVAMYGEGKTRGKCTELLFASTTNQALAGITVDEVVEDLRPYLKMFFFKNYQSIRLVSSGGVQPNLNMGIVENTVVPLCSTAEQAVIVSRLEAKLSTLDALEADIGAQLARSRALRQSILKRAFEGKLVPQDPTDEPASALLARIKAERDAAPKPKRKRKAKA